ncbi:hypothetical protein HID58_093990 [Brassica napus]|nr:hypothetical protein HID58_093990 [Brassica napus]CAF2097506.1 unnamed protein product [Brassica napus]CAG7875455.1 unnamed protein product [Brassica rapa]
MAVWCVAASFMSSISFVLLHLRRFISRLITVVIRGCVVSCCCLLVLWGFGDWPCFRPFVAVTLQHPQSLAVFVWSFCSRSSSLGMKLWVGVAASLTVEMHYLLRGSGRSREINLRLPPQEPLFFIECLSSVSLDSQLLLRKVSGLAGSGLIVSVIAGAGSSIRLRLLPSKYPRDCSVSIHTQDQSSHLQFTVN